MFNWLTFLDLALKHVVSLVENGRLARFAVSEDGAAAGWSQVLLNLSFIKSKPGEDSNELSIVVGGV